MLVWISHSGRLPLELMSWKIGLTQKTFLDLVENMSLLPFYDVSVKV